MAADPAIRGCSAAAEKVFSGREEFGADSSNLFRTILALVLWLGAIHLIIALVLFAVLFLPLSKAPLFVPSSSYSSAFSFSFFFFLCFDLIEFRFFFFRIFGLLFVFMVIPVDEKSKFGRRLSR